MGRVPYWACRVSVTYAKPLVNEQQVIKLLAAAGMLSGVGDWRPQKGKGDFGTFELVDELDQEWAAITGITAEQQREALANPVCYDPETEDLLSWFKEEIARRGIHALDEEELHEEEFEWDDALAAEQHRLMQARGLIRSIRLSITTETIRLNTVAYVQC